MKKAGKIGKTLKIFFSSVLCLAALVCVCTRIPQCFSSETPAVLAAAAFTLTDGTYKITSEEETSPAPSSEIEDIPEQSTPEIKKQQTKPAERDKSDYYDSYGDHSGENKYEIAEETFTGGTSIENFFVKNKTGVSYDFSSYLAKPLTFSVEKNSGSPQVLIYHTHTTEGYMDEDVDFFYDSFYSRTEDSTFSVVAVGDKITESLNNNGIAAYHDTTIHDATYQGSYDRSAETVAADMKKFSDIKVVIDIHRDAIGTEERKVKPVFTYNGIKGAQIMILSGCDDGSDWFPNWENNLNFALKIQQKAEEMYPGMTRPLDFDYFRYNEFICDGSLLIEVGTEANSIDEVEYTGELLGNVLAQVLG